MQLSATRGYFLRELGLNYPAPLEEDAMFLLGLFSLLGVILNQTMEQALSFLSLDPEIADTLLGEQTEARAWLDLAIAYEKGDWDTVDRLMHELALDPAQVANSYNSALANSSFFLPESSNPQ
jgi:EAL and modified HD-GYP domain-containing signal transduction protein